MSGRGPEPAGDSGGSGAGPGGGGSGGDLTESERIEREEFARGHIDPGQEPVEPRPAATMVLARPGREGARGEGRGASGAAAGDDASARDTASGASGPEAAGRSDRESPLELLFLRRPETSRFAAGAYVFPGGVVDPGDRAADLGGRMGEGTTTAEPAALVAALREAFEETGLVPSDDAPPRDELQGAREALLRGDADFEEVVERLDLEFRGLRVAYFARWITPPKLSRRYDARFFLAEHRGGEPRLVHGEHTEWVWMEPREALRRFERGDFPMLYPTRKTVEELTGLGSIEAAFRSFRRRTVEPVRPRLLVEGDAVTPVLPEEPRYDEAGPESVGAPGRDGT